MHLLKRALVGATATAAAIGGFMPAGATGNGAPSGAHYNLNIVGVEKDKTMNGQLDTGNVIFVGLGTPKSDPNAVTVRTDIMLSPGDFSVLDKNGTDGEAAFQLPANGTTGTTYQVWARALGKPGGSAEVTTCAEDVTNNGSTTDEVCSTENEVFTRYSGKDGGRSTFKNVTPALTTIVITEAGEPAAYFACGGTDTAGDTGEIRVGLFDGCLENYFWKYDNNGLRLLQLRFYEVA